MVDGRVVEFGGPELADQPEAEGRAGVATRPHDNRARTAGRGRRARRLPHPGASGQRPPAGLPGLGRYQPEAVVQVLDAMDAYYRRHNANVHRGRPHPGRGSDPAVRGGLGKVARFVGASERATVFTKNISEAINLVAYAWGLRNLRQGGRDPGHRDGAPLQPGALAAGGRHDRARVRAVPVTGDYLLDLDALDGLLGERTRMVAVSAMSNVLGTVNPVAEIAERAHAAGALVLADAAQAVPHAGVRLDTLGVDFLGFTGHKALGPMGVGVLAAREELLESMEPFLGAGRDDPRRRHRMGHLERHPVAVRGRHAQRGRGGRAGGGRRLPPGARHGPGPGP